MSSDQYRRQVQQVQEEIGRLQAGKSREADKAAREIRLANEASSAASRATSASTRSSKLKEVSRHREEEARSQKRIADSEGRLARAQKRLTDTHRSLRREEEREQREQAQRAKREARENQERFRSIGSMLKKRSAIHEQTLRELGRLQQLPQELVVLFVASNPIDQSRLRLDEEARSIGETIRKSDHRAAVKLQSCWAARPLDLIQGMNEHRPGIVHFSGHGSETNELLFQDELGQTKLVSKEAIAQTI